MERGQPVSIELAEELADVLGVELSMIAIENEDRQKEQAFRKETSRESVVPIGKVGRQFILLLIASILLPLGYLSSIILTDGDQVVSESSNSTPEHLVFLGDLHRDNPVRVNAYIDRVTDLLLSEVSGKRLRFGDRLTFATAGDAQTLRHLDPRWNRSITLESRGANPKDVSRFLSDQVTSLAVMPAQENSKLLWALQELASQVDCSRENVTVYVLSNVVEAVSIANDQVNIEGLTGQPFAGCSEVVFLGIGASFSGDISILPAVERLMDTAMQAVGFSAVEFLR